MNVVKVNGDVVEGDVGCDDSDGDCEGDGAEGI